MQDQSPTTAPSIWKKRKYLRLAWMGLFALAIAGMMLVILFLDRTTWVGDDGVLHEPLFGFIPLSLLCMLVAIILLLIDGALTLWKRYRGC